MKSSYVVLCATFAAASFTSSVQAEAILHAFNWKYADVTANAAQIAAAGYKKVLISPALKSSGNEWWLVTNLKICESLTHLLATKPTYKH